MSQTKTVVRTLEIPVAQVKPSPYQPRLTFDLEDIRGSIQRDGILVPLTVRKKDGYYELIDGERRLRLAKALGYKTLPCDVIDIDDDTARRMVWKVNTLRKDYEPKEKAVFFKTMQEKYGMNLRGIAREYDTDEHTVKAYLNVFTLPDEYQQMIWGRVIPLGVVQELGTLFNGAVYTASKLTPEDNPHIFDMLNRAAKEKGFDFMQAREALKPYLGKLREEQVEKAKEALAKVKPKAEVPKTPEEFEEAAKALREEAKRRKSPKQISEEKQKKIREVLEGKNSVATRIEKAKDLGIDTKWMEKEKKKIENKPSSQPDETLSDAKALKTKINETISNFQQKQKEVEIRQKVEKDFKEKKKEEIKEELRKDETFKAELRTELMKDMAAPARVEALPVEIPEEEAKVLRGRIEEQRKKMAEWMNDPEIQKRGELFKNWVAHGAMLDVMSSVFCPKDGSEKSTWKDLRWTCCGLSVEEAYEMLRKKLEKGR